MRIACSGFIICLRPKSDHCFHGVERVDLQGIERRLLIFNVRRSS